VSAPALGRPAPPLRLVPSPYPQPARPLSRPRVRRAPQLEPPYDDDCGDGPQLWLVPLADELPFEEPAPRRFRQPPEFFDRQPTSRRRLPDPEPWAARLIQAVLEMLVGRRPAAQLQEWTSPAVLELLASSATEPRWATGGSPPAVRSVRVSEPADGVAEVCAVVQRGEQYFAVAARLEGLDGRWRCEAIEVG